MKQLNERLKEIRTQHGYTMKALCDKTGMPLRTYQNYEAGIREPSISAILALADVYNVTTDYLLGRAPQTDPFAMLDFQVDIGEDAVMGQYMQLPKPWRKILLEVMKQLGDAAERGERQTGQTTDEDEIVETTTAGVLHDRLEAATDAEAEETAG